jgi:hypothetical protein
MYKLVKVLCSACAQATGKLPKSMHSLSTKPASVMLNVFNPHTLHTVFGHMTSTLVHKLNPHFNRLVKLIFHSIHLAYNYNYLYINKRSKGLLT